MERSDTRLYSIWENMKTRCENPNNKYYHRYGGRGIKVCEEWKNNFYLFEDWAYSNGYREYLTIDRINNNGDYCPENCRWTTQDVQMRNTSKSIFVTIDGVRRPLVEWAEISGINIETMRRRLSKGDSGMYLIRPLNTRVRNKKKPPLYEINGIKKTAEEWSREIGISTSTFNFRYKKGCRNNDLLKPNRNKQKKL